MLHRLKVKQKIIIGFGLIGFLLMGACYFFYSSLSGIQNESTTLEQVAVPIHNESKEIQIILLKMAKASAVGFTKESSEEISNAQLIFNTANEQLAKLQPQLQNRLKDQKALKNLNAESRLLTETFVGSVKSMFTAKLNTVNIQSALDQQSLKAQDIINEASALMLDLGYIENAKFAKELESIVGTASRIESQLFAVTNVIKEFAQTTDRTVYEQTVEQLKFTFSDVKNLVDHLNKQVEGIPTDNIMESFTEQYNQVPETFEGDNGLFAIVKDKIEYVENSKVAMLESEQSSAQTLESLDRIIVLAKNQFNQLQQNVNDSIINAQRVVFVLAVVFLVLAIVIAFITIRAMITPLNAVNKSLNRIAQGDLTRPLKVTQEDEFGHLAIHLNKVSEDLTKLIKKIAQDGAFLTDSAKESKQQSNQIFEAAKIQIESVNNAFTALEHINNSTKQVSNQAVETEQQVSDAKKQSDQIRDIGQSTNDRIKQLDATLVTAVSVMDRLSQHSSGIGSISHTIGDIAEQTNLLALNAAIEAARAGEQGRGFSVVADEVRTLASRTQASTAEIYQMIEALQQETTSAVDAIATGRNEAEQCFEQSEGLNQMIVNIDKALENIATMSHQINGNTKLQLEYSKELNGAMSEVSTTSENSAGFANTMKQNSAEITELASSLETSVSTFKFN
jgi:methyl-accepting chemotaxis protein